MQPENHVTEVRVLGLPPLPEIKPGDNVVALIVDAFERGNIEPESTDVLVVTHKIVSKAEGRLVDLTTVQPSSLAKTFADMYGKDPRQVEVAMAEAARIVRMDRGIMITETSHGFTCANSGVDASNVSDDIVCLLPEEPDQSALNIRNGIGAHFGQAPGVIISDSFGRPWRNGIVNVAIGVAGMAPLIDYRGTYDPAGYELHVTVIAIADEIASAAELVMNKLDRRPLALIRNYHPPLDAESGSGQDLIMDPGKDMFR